MGNEHLNLIEREYYERLRNDTITERWVFGIYYAIIAICFLGIIVDALRSYNG